MLKLSFFMFCQQIFTTKTPQTTFTKIFFVFICYFVKHKSAKIFDVHIMRFITIKYKQRIHRIFKFLTRNVNWKSQLVFITKHVNANVIFHLSLVKIFFLHRKLNSILIKIFKKFFIFFL